MNPLKLTFTANEQALTKTDNFTDFASNTVSYVEATFTLGENWSGYDSVRAVWKTDYYTISTVLDANFTCVVPTEVLRYKAKVFVNLVGSIVENDTLTDRLTTFPVLALTVKANAAVTGSETAPVTPSQFEQFVDTVRDAAGSISDYSYDSEAWAVGKRGGVDVPSTDPTYHNNSKYWAEQNAGLSDEVADLKSDINEIATISELASVNKYNKDNVESGFWSTTDGTTLVSNDNYSAGKTFVPVVGGTTYNLYWVNNGTVESTSWHYVAWYDESKSFISGSAVSTSSVTAPNNAVYVRFSVQTEKKNTFMAVSSDVTPTEFIPYEETKSISINNDVAIPRVEEKLNLIATFGNGESANKYDKSDVALGYWNISDGVTLVSNSNYSAQNVYSKVTAGNTYNIYWINNGTVEATSWHYVAWYDEDKNFISGSAVTTSSVVAPNNATYVRFSAQTDKKSTFMVVDSGTTPTAYIPYAVNPSVAINDDVKMPSVLSGVKVDIIGDSWSAVNDTADTKYTDLLVSKDKIDLNVLAYSGSGYHKPTSSNKPFYTQALSVRATADIVFIFGSFNDVSDIIGGTEIGDVTDSGTTTICGCINTTIDNILSVNPSAKILVATPGAWSGYNANNDGNNANNPTALAYVEAIKNVCFKRGYECKDMLRCMNLKPWINSFKTAYQPDGTHPNNAGHLKYVYPVIKNYLSTVV